MWQRCRSMAMTPPAGGWMRYMHPEHRAAPGLAGPAIHVNSGLGDAGERGQGCSGHRVGRWG